MMSFQKANELFRTGQYEEALHMYQELGKEYGTAVVQFNILKCREKLGSDKSEIKATINEYFDCVYVVNLKHHIKKRLQVVHQLKKLGIEFELVEAVNGYKDATIQKQFLEYKSKPLGQLKRFPQWNDREIWRKQHYIGSQGALGYIYSYLKVFDLAKKQGHKKILILEDDVIFCYDFMPKFFGFMEKVADTTDDWKVLQLGASQYGWDSVNLDEAQQNGYYLPKMVDTCGSFAMAIDMSIVDELSELLKCFESPFDLFPLGEIYEKYKGQCFVAYPNIVMADVSSSSIRDEKRQQKTHAEKMKWNLDMFPFPAPLISVGLVLTAREHAQYVPLFTLSETYGIDLKLYYMSGDGLRPIHNMEIFCSDNSISTNVSSIQTELFVDIIGKVVWSGYSLTEKDVASFVQYKLGLLSRNICANIVDMDNEYKPTCVKGMVSVIIPTYQRKEVLINAVESVLMQDYPSKEVIVVDDNVSKDDEYSKFISEQIAKIKQERKLDNLIYIKHTKNRNASSARNTGIMRSSGEYICFLDDDDTYLQGRLSKSVGKLKNRSESVHAVYCGFSGWNGVDKLEPYRYKKGKFLLELLTLNYASHFICTNTVTYTREAVMKLNGFNESYRRHQDLEFNIRYFQLYDVDVVKEILVELRPNKELVTGSNMLKNWDFFNLKMKFLSEFDSLITSFGPGVAKQIYEIHWSELVKHMDPKLLENHYDYRNFSSFYYKK